MVGGGNRTRTSATEALARFITVAVQPSTKLIGLPETT
jgi:hypothetical protein